MQPNNGGSGSHRMNVSQLSIQELQRVQQEMQARLRQQRQSTSQGGGMMMRRQQQQRLMAQQMGNQQQVQRNSLSSMDHATLLLLQQQQLTGSSGRSTTSSTGRMPEQNSTHAALYMNAIQSNSRAERQDSLGSQSSASSMGRFAGGMNQNPNRLPLRHGGGPSLQAQAMLIEQRQLQQMGSSTMFMGGGTNPQLAAATTSEHLLIQQQRMMADIKRQLQNQNQLGHHHHRRTSSSSLDSQRQASQQQQSQPSKLTRNPISSSDGGVQDYVGISSLPNSGSSVNPSRERKFSISNVEPISLASVLGDDQDRRGSTGSQTSMDRVYGGSTSLTEEQLQALQQQQNHLLSALLPAAPDYDVVQSQQQVSLTQEPLASSEHQPSPAGETMWRGTSIESGANVKQGNLGVTSVHDLLPKLFGSPHHTSDTWNSTGGQVYMEGTFEGGWQSNADLPERREVIFSIVKLIDQTQPPDSDNAFKRLPQMAKRIEEHLYRTAKSKEEYLDLRTLKKRLQNVAKDLDLSRSSSAGQPPKIASQVRSMQSDARLSVADKRITVTQQHLQQMQQLQELQQRGISDQQRSLLQIQPRGEHSLVASLPPVGQTHDSSQLNAIHTGILKATSKYQDPALDRRRKVIKQQQQRLLLLRHASKCKAGASCKTKYCGQMVALWKHMKKCRNKSCKTSHCLSSRCVLNHYRMCKSENRTMTCEVCAPVMHQIKALKSSTESKNSPKDESPSSLIVRSVPGEFSSTDSMDSNNIRNLAEIEFTQSKLREQQKLLKQLKEQQAQILEQQNQIRQQQRRTQPQSEEEIQLEQQQGLLQQLNQVFEQQQSLLEREVTENSSLKTGDLSPLPVDAFAESPMESSIASGNLQPKLQRQCNSNPSGRHLSMRGRGSKGKILSAVRNSRDSPSSTRKRPAIDHTTANLATDASGYIPRGKAARVVGSVPQQKMLQQGDATYTTSLIQSMPIDAIERHLASLNNKMHITPQTISERCLPLVRKLIDDQFGWVFRDPVDPIALGLPDYFDVIKNPMHLYYVEAKLLKNEYQDIDSFSRDTRLVFNNAILYNGEDSEVGEMAAILLCLFDKDIKALLKDIGHDQRNLKHGDDSCILCGSYRRLFEPTTLYCNGACGMQWIRRNASYFTDHAKQNHWCASCYAGLQDNEPISLEDGSKIRKSDLQKLKNDGLPEEAWVQCDECNGWCHQICALFNGRKNKNTAKYRCPKCHIDKKRAGEPLGLQKEVTVAKDLPSCKMSTAIENGLRKALASAYEERALDIGVDVCEVQKADGLFVRVVSNLEKKHVVRDEMYSRYAKHGSASDFPVRSKCIALFQTIDGVDVILFAMYVYEYGDSCPNPNRRRVYISYLDSVFYFKPKYYRTIAYHALIIEYLRYVKERGFHTAHIWSCPPSNGDDYVFYCHPKEQLVPREDMLRQWYHRMLEKAKDEGIVLEILTLYDEYFANNGKDALSGISCNPTCLPYFEGDYIPGEIENIIKEIGDEEQLADISGGVAKTAQDAVMVALGEAMYNMRENFIVVRLRSNDFIAAVGKGEDVTDWIDIEGQTGVFSTKRIKIGSKDSSCLTKPSAVSKRIVVEKIEDIAVKSFAEGQPGAIDGTKNVSRAAVGAISNASTELPVLGYRIDQTTTRENPSVADDSYRQISEHDRVNLDVESKDGISGVNDGRTAKGESNISTAVDARERNIENASADATKLSENINAIEDEECTQSTEKSMTSSKRGLDEIEPSLPKHVKPVGSTNDEDGPQETEMFESRQQFLNYCQANHLQFDELRRAKHSTMMILFQLHNPSAPMFLQQCGACYRDITHGTRYHCRDCSSFDLCQDCYEPVTTGLWAKRDSRFTHNFQHTFVAIDMEAPEDLGKGTKERSRTIKLHLELLSHAATCGGPPICSLNNCRRMKKLFEHVESCEVTYRKGCKICSRLLSLLTIHARMCTVRGSCPLPFCDRIRERNKRRQQQQRLMDDRRRQAQNDLYRREAAS